MSTQTEGPTVRDRIDEHPSASLDNVKETTARELIIRFAAGAATSVASGLVALAFGPRVGGILLGFPAILAASLTLIAEEEDARDAREDARGAIVGACALTLFAVVAALTFGDLSGGVVLALATVVWLLAAVLLYVVLWWR
jgi:uncharacterized membrane protein (GlpM family)